MTLLPKLPSPAYRYGAMVMRWVDGDTVDCLVDLGFSTWKLMRFRVDGVNTPERGQNGWAEATEFCERMLPPESIVAITSTKTEKYGRYLATIHLADGTTLNQRLLDSGHAKPYAEAVKK